MAIQYIQPGKPDQYAYIKRFNRMLREELLDANLFIRLDDVREAVYWWHIECKEQRPHDALSGIPPTAYRIKNAENSTYELSARRGDLRNPIGPARLGKPSPAAISQQYCAMQMAA